MKFFGVSAAETNVNRVPQNWYSAQRAAAPARITLLRRTASCTLMLAAALLAATVLSAADVKPHMKEGKSRQRHGRIF